MIQERLLLTINRLYPQLDDPASLDKIDGGIENDVLRLQTNGRSFIARIHNKRSREDVCEEVDVLRNTDFSRFLVPEIIVNSNGSLVSTFDDRPLTIYPEIDGTHSTKVTSEFVDDMRAFIELLHAGGQCVSTSGPTLDNTITMAQKIIDCGVRNADEIDLELSTLGAVSELLSETPRVAIHSDLGPSNVLLTQESRLAGVIDFDDIYMDHSIFDITGFIRGYAFTNNYRYDPKIGLSIWRHFSEKFPQLSDDDISIILQFTCFRFYILILWSDIFLRNGDLLDLTAAGFNNDYVRWRSMKSQQR